MKLGLLIVAAAAPSLFLLTFFYLKDRYEREPLLQILMAFGLGLYSMIAAQGMASTAEGWVSAEWLATGGEPAPAIVPAVARPAPRPLTIVPLVHAPDDPGPDAEPLVESELVARPRTDVWRRLGALFR